MSQVAELMPRVRKSYKIDERVANALAAAALKQNMSANRYLENLLFSHGKAVGVIPFDMQPLGETRGGNRNKPEGDIDAPEAS